MCANCPHDLWEHEFIDYENYDSLIFGRCETAGCPCEHHEEGTFTAPEAQQSPPPPSPRKRRV